LADTIREQCAKRLSGLKAVRQPYEADYEEIAALASAVRSDFLGRAGGSGRRRARAALYDSSAIRSFRILASGMTSGLSSRSRPWFKISLADRDLASFPAVAVWLSAVEEEIYRFLGRTNFYEAVQNGYLELGLFGTEATTMIEHDRVGAVCHALTAGEYWIAQSDANRPDTLYRTVPMSVLQVVQAFGTAKLSDRVRTLYDGGKYDETVPVFHAIEPQIGRDVKAHGKRGMRYRSVWWDQNDDRRDVVLRDSGYRDQPFWAPRWDTRSSTARCRQERRATTSCRPGRRPRAFMGTSSAIFREILTEPPPSFASIQPRIRLMRRRRSSLTFGRPEIGRDTITYSSRPLRSSGCHGTISLMGEGIIRP